MRFNLLNLKENSKPTISYKLYFNKLDASVMTVFELSGIGMAQLRSILNSILPALNRKSSVPVSGDDVDSVLSDVESLPLDPNCFWIVSRSMSGAVRRVKRLYRVNHRIEVLSFGMVSGELVRALDGSVRIHVVFKGVGANV